jgi:hypothetical protein
MPALTHRDKRALRLGAIGILVYLVLFFGFRGGKYFAGKRADYLRLVREARELQLEIQPYRDKAEVVRKLMESSKLDPAKLSRATVIAQANAAIQKAATSLHLQVGPVRESPARPGNNELGSMQLETLGPVPALMTFLRQTETLGFPIIIESLQISSDPAKPGPLKMNLTLVILDFDQWKKEANHA